MTSVSSNHKARAYHFPSPLVIKSTSKLTVMSGNASLVHEGDLLVRIVDDQLIELIPMERIKTELDSVQTQLVENKPKAEALDFVIPKDYQFFFKTEATRTSYGDTKATYEYYKREKDVSYFMLISRGEKTEYWYDLGSLFDQKSKIAIALRAFTREKPFYRRDLKPHLMPSPLKQSQLIKACLEILAMEGFLNVQKVPIGEQELERYTRTAKMLP